MQRNEYANEINALFENYKTFMETRDNEHPFNETEVDFILDIIRKYNDFVSKIWKRDIALSRGDVKDFDKWIHDILSTYLCIGYERLEQILKTPKDHGFYAYGTAFTNEFLIYSPEDVFHELLPKINSYKFNDILMRNLAVMLQAYPEFNKLSVI